ncbi:Histone deacetylase 2 [Cladochytrium tenue]|nr:Histone deacetylase 2 [Cladochytrium tenue]
MVPEIPYHEYFEGYGPEYRLDIPASNMDNLNSRVYLEKIKERVLESLRHVSYAPSVQLQEVPPDRYSDDDDSEDERMQEASSAAAAGSLLAATKPKDVRITRRMRDNYRVPETALSDSEDEGEGGRRDRASYRNSSATATRARGLVGGGLTNMSVTTEEEDRAIDEVVRDTEGA